MFLNDLSFSSALSACVCVPRSGGTVYLAGLRRRVRVCVCVCWLLVPTNAQQKKRKQLISHRRPKNRHFSATLSNIWNQRHTRNKNKKKNKNIRKSTTPKTTHYSHTLAYWCVFVCTHSVLEPRTKDEEEERSFCAQHKNTVSDTILLFLAYWFTATNIVERVPNTFSRSNEISYEANQLTNERTCT